MDKLRTSLKACHWCVDCGLTLACWALWLTLTATLVTQIWVLSQRELELPDFILRRLEASIAEQGLRAEFGQARFTPGGEIRVDNLKIGLRAQVDDLVRADYVRLKLPPWDLLVGAISLREIEAGGVDLLVPAMFSVTGSNDALVSDLHTRFTFAEGDVVNVHYLSARAFTHRVTARGSLYLPALSPTTEPARDKLYWVRQYVQTVRNLSRQTLVLSQLDPTLIDLVFTADQERTARVDGRILADTMHVPAKVNLPLPAGMSSPVAREFSLHVGTRLPLKPGDTLRAQVSWTDLSAGPAWHLGPGSLNATLPWPSPEGEAGEGSVGLQLGSITLPYGHIPAAVLTTDLRGLEVARVDSSLWLAGEPWAASYTALPQGSSRIDLAGTVTNALVSEIVDQLHNDKLIDVLEMTDPGQIAATITLGPDQKLRSIDGRLASHRVIARNVAIDRAAGSFHFEDGHIQVSDIVLAVQDSAAHGTFSTNLANREFRFLLAGHLQPMLIEGWFRGWWDKFWEIFVFDGAPPDANVDVQGVWGKPFDTSVFVHASGNDIGLWQAKFDTLETSVFVRPHFFELPHFRVTQGERWGQGQLSRLFDLEQKDWVRISTDIETNLALSVWPQLFPDIAGPIVAPYAFSIPPNLHLSGDIYGPASPQSGDRNLVVQVSSEGSFKFYDFPLNDLGTTARIDRENVRVEGLSVGFARGRVTGNALLQETGTRRSLAFDAQLEDAELGAAVHTLRAYTALQNGENLPDEKIGSDAIEEARFDLALSAEGNPSNLYSFTGMGNTSIKGNALGNIRLFGVLSDFLKGAGFGFSSVRVDEGVANFAVKGPDLDFTTVRLWGRQAAIEGRGIYNVPSGELDFRAVIKPFDESHNLLSNTLGFFLSPLTQVLEVKLTGPLAEPKWAFMYGPTNFFRQFRADSNRATSPTPSPQLPPRPTGETGTSP